MKKNIFLNLKTYIYNYIIMNPKIIKIKSIKKINNIDDDTFNINDLFI